ncbi:hypothetical protein [Bifidobacterium choerinum]|uniref:hypothetical protein n=1 Tax=Bifidobacterium choerinum TaxID=35760 RepID=UPI003F8DDEA1
MSNPSKTKGTRFETAVCDYLAWALDDDRIQRLTLHGTKDIGDIGGIRYAGCKVTVECKATATPHYRRHWAECLVEMSNGDANWGVVVWKRPGVGIDTRDKVGTHLAYTRRDVFDAMIYELPHVTRRMLTERIRGIPRNADLVGMSLADWALLLNHGLPLGPDE